MLTSTNKDKINQLPTFGLQALPLTTLHKGFSRKHDGMINVEYVIVFIMVLETERNTD